MSFAPLPVIEHPITVRWQHRVFFTRNLFHPENPLLAKVLCSNNEIQPARVWMVVDVGLAQAQPEWLASVIPWFAQHRGTLELVSPPLVYPGGETVKNDWAHLHSLLQEIEKHRLDRHNYLIAAGGGALLDLAGLAAALAHRGLRLIRLPSTVLAQADSGVGVKNGINAFGKKNFLGTFAPPYAVINDLALLHTLAERDRRAGWVEAVKVACLKDAAFFAQLEREAQALLDFEPQAVQSAIYRCAELHVTHIAQGGDPFEFGSARPLDFGHWAAHKLEALSDWTLRHGEAVAMGIAVDVLCARQAGWLPAPAAGRILALLHQLGFSLYSPLMEKNTAAGQWALWEGLQEFREHLGGQLRLTQLRDIGQSFETDHLDPRWVRQAVQVLKQGV
ncbi:3-dehydroquinate synthase [Fontisphaera persica]|uniref:3-dehydroquinate synthase n=1 Tax=Fontisphaera persica TaxID=2974023 RepID=UPI0024C08A1F|nr:3-dehydroquinate synthase [Fontisphaera persica]WCJ61183.1 3-dehydroquinate synthase [Fontisphaera persica]